MGQNSTLTDIEWDEVVRLLIVDEGVRMQAYDDKTGRTVHAPIGRLTIGIGCNIQDVPLTLDEVKYLCINRLRLCEKELIKLPFYSKLSFIRKYVILNISYQVSVYKFFKFTETIKAITDENWELAAKEILDSEVGRQFPERYKRLSNMMLNNRIK